MCFRHELKNPNSNCEKTNDSNVADEIEPRGRNFNGHLSHYFGDNPKGTREEQDAARLFWEYAHASAVPEGHGPGKHGKTIYSLMSQLSGSIEPHVI